ncbi:hypothetical protein [Borrelia sp. RT1S]|uniref:hypothetical protein n=1 Tax=Borrelia sp. RT1S TaxID=2898580 RepID=UPI001E5F2832|nr:hypothetical protein [Borrelia sp. RT1S]UGQ16834.1 hypothetical protein LSO05_00010 [Borrelia sp. RT1S]UGQ18025.1 hypothetical protein LSO05_06210 [Borrelia sp. RT1S]
MKRVDKRTFPMALVCDNYVKKGGIFFGDAEYEANYKARVNGYVIDFFRIPRSLKNKYEVNIKSLSDPELPFGNIAMNCINTFKLIVDIVNMQTGNNYDYDKFITDTETEKMLYYGAKVVSALSRHFDEISGNNHNEGYYEWEKGWIERKWIDYEPSDIEIKEMQESNRKLDPEMSIGARGKLRKSGMSKAELHLLRAIEKAGN